MQMCEWRLDRIFSYTWLWTCLFDFEMQNLDRFVDIIYMKILELLAKLFSDPQAQQDLFTFFIARKIHLLPRMPQTLFSLQ